MARVSIWMALGCCACGGGGGVAAAADAGPAAQSGGQAGTVSAAGQGGGTTPAGGGSGGTDPAPPQGGSAGANPAGAPSTLAMVSGNGAALLEGWPGATLGVRLTDAAGLPVADVPVTWSVVSGDGVNITSPSLPTTPTGADGISARMIQGVAFASNQAFGAGVVRASSAVGQVDFTTVAVHVTNMGPIGPLLTLLAPQGLDLGEQKAGSVLSAGAKLQAVIQAGGFTGTPLPGVALRFVDANDHAAQGAVGCVGGTVLSDTTGMASCDLAVGTALGEHWVAAIGGESTVFSAIRLVVVP